tara:strand:+ start:7866 stop:8039 length:174 start_codon:yes stop_codon:yes gene_type:complete
VEGSVVQIYGLRPARKSQSRMLTDEHRFMAASKVLGEETVKGGDDKGAKEEGREGEK